MGTDQEDEQRAGPVASLLGVRPAEIPQVRGLMGVAFLLGTGLVLFYSSANAIFLTRYDITVLPVVYIVNAAAVILVGVIYGTLSKRTAPATALVRLTIALSTSVAGLWLWATLSDDRVVSFVLATWFRLLFIYAVLGLWEIASAVFDIRQAKRLFAAVALGMMMAFVIGGALAPAIGSAVGTTNMVGLASVFLALYSFRFSALLSTTSVAERSADSAPAAPAGPREIVRDRYSRRMVWMKSVTILLLYVTEYVFYEQAADTFDSEVSLAGFLGVFMGLMTVFMVLVTGLVSGRYISRFGIRVATMTLPVGMVLIAVPSGLYGTLVAVDTVFFVLVAITLATDHVLGNAIGEPAGAVLFQPMPPERRMRVRLAVDGWLGSLALVVAGILLMVLNALDLDNVAPYMFLIAAVAAVGVLVAVLQYRDYVISLHEATTLGFGDTATGIDPLDVDVLTDAAGSSDPGAAVAAAGLARALEHDDGTQLVAALLSHPDPDVVDLAIHDTARWDSAGTAAGLASVVERGDLPVQTRGRALVALARVDPAAAAAAAEQTDTPMRPHRLAVGLVNPDTRAAAQAELCSMARAADPDDRLDACEAMRSGRVVSEAIIPLVNDPDARVASAAIDATHGRVDTEVLGSLLEASANPELRRSAIGALGRVDGPVSALVAEHLPDMTTDLQTQVLTSVPVDAQAHTAIQRLLASPTPSTLRRAAYDALCPLPGAPEGFDAEHPVAMDLACADDAAQMRRELGAGFGALNAAMREEFALAQRAILGGLRLGTRAGRVDDIELLLDGDDEDDRANAVEALDVTIEGQLRRRIVDTLECLDVADAGALGPEPTAAFARSRLAEVAGDPRWQPWTRTVAAEALDAIEALPDNETLYRETIPVTALTSTVLTLKSVDIFSTLPHDVLAQLAELGDRRSFGAGETIIERDTMGDDLYVLLAGEADVTTATEATHRLSERTVFGELAILDPGPRSATVVAATGVDVLVVDRRTLLTLTERRPSVMADIARVLARRLRA